MAWSSSEWLPVSRRPLTAMRWTPFCGGVGSILSWLITASLQTRGPGGGRRGGPGGRTRLDRMAGFAKDVCVLPAQLNRVSALRCGGDAARIVQDRMAYVFIRLRIPARLSGPPANASAMPSGAPAPGFVAHKRRRAPTQSRDDGAG